MTSVGEATPPLSGDAVITADYILVCQTILAVTIDTAAAAVADVSRP